MNKKKRFWFLTLLLTLILAACGGVAKEYIEKYDLGMRYLNEGNYEEAVLAFTAAIEIDDKLPDAYIGRGDAFIMWAEAISDVAEEKTELALADFLKAIDLDKKNADIYVKAADIYIRNGDLDAAKELLEKGVKATGDEKLKEMLQDIEKKLEDSFLTRHDYVEFKEIAEEDQKFINNLIASLESGNISNANSMILQSQFESIVRKYESDSWGYTFYTQNDNYKIEMHHEADEGNPRIEIHPENGTGYVCSYYAAYGDAEYTYLEGQCSNWNWNGSYEVTREIVSREGGWGMPISEKGVAIDGLVHGDYVEVRVRDGETKTTEITYDMGKELRHIDSESGEWPVEDDGYLKTPSSSVPEEDPAWWDWNA